MHPSQRPRKRLLIGSLAFSTVFAATVAGLLAPAAAPSPEMHGPGYRAAMPAELPPSAASAANNAQENLALPPVLSAADADRYRAIFLLCQDGSWAQADALAAELDNTSLLGHVLAARYAGKHYNASFAELNAWLAAYADHPQAQEIYRLALARRKGGDAPLAGLAAKNTLAGYGDDNGLSGAGRRMNAIEDSAWNGREDAYAQWSAVEAGIDAGALEEAQQQLADADLLSPLESDVARWHLAANYLYRGDAQQAYALAQASAERSGDAIAAVHWVAGIAAWQQENISAGAQHFSAMADAAERLSPWEASAAAFWAYRAFSKQGEAEKAAHYLAEAARHPRTFYGVLARKVKGESLGVQEASLPALSAAQARALYQDPGVARVVALVQARQQALAEKELRGMFLRAGREKRVQLLTLAQALELPAVQIAMAKTLSAGGRGFDTALYPTPGWEPAAGFAVDPALIFAFARQESGFHADARGGGGAAGLMQLMPQTARSMRRHAALDEQAAENIFEPEANLALGQTYLNYLLKNPLVKGNLIYLAAAYNAGPAKVSDWQKTISHHGDPLLFLESIPYGLTRNYIAQVLTGYWMYQEIEGRRLTSAIALAKGQWPRYERQDKTRVVDNALATRG